MPTKIIYGRNSLKDIDIYINHRKALLVTSQGFVKRGLVDEIVTYTNNFYMAGNMGGALSLGFGAAKAGKKVIVCGGDAEFVMHMGGLTTAGRDANNIDLTYILFDNEQNKSTGGQNTYQNHLDYNDIVRGTGFGVEGNVITSVEGFKTAVKDINGLKFIHVKCGVDDETPRPPLNVVRINEFG